MPSASSGEKGEPRPSPSGMLLGRTQMIGSTSCCCPSDWGQARALRRHRLSPLTGSYLAARHAVRPHPDQDLDLTVIGVAQEVPGVVAPADLIARLPHRPARGGGGGGSWYRADGERADAPAGGQHG